MKTLKKTLFLIFTLTMLMGMTAMAADSPSKSTFKPALKKTSTVYNGKTQKATVVVKDGTKTLKEGVDYKVSGASHKNAGKYTVKVTGIGKYAGKTWTAKYTVKQAKQTVKLSKSSYTVKASKVKKATQSTSLKVTKKGGVTKYATSSKYIKVKNGKIYVKKGIKKGTYRVKVAVRSANYIDVVKYVKVKVK